MKKILLILFPIFLLTACEKKDMNWNLPRNNPADPQNNSSANNNNNNVGPVKFTQYFIVNNDPLKAGNWLYMKIYVKNTGTATAKEVRYTVSTNSPYVTMVFAPTQTLLKVKDITAGQEVLLEEYGYGNNYTIYFKIDASTPIGTQINFSLALSDVNSNQWSDSFSITTVP